MKAQIWAFAALVAACDDFPMDEGGTDLELHYALDGDATESSSEHKDGVMTACSPAADRFGVAAGAVRFDEDSSVLSISNVELSPPYSVSLWFDRTGHGTAAHPCAGGELDAILFAGYRFMLAIDPDGESIVYAVESDAARETPLMIDPPSPGWHHVVLIDRGATGELWIDGQRRANALLPEAPRHASFLTLGGHPADRCGARAVMDEVWIYGRALKSAEIDELLHAM